MLGELLNVGRTSEVYAYGRGSVAKVLATHVPRHWAQIEAELTESVRSVGVPAPEVRDVIDIDGRPAIISERVVGPSMWERMLAEPERRASLIADFASMQRTIHAAGVPEGVPSLVERMCSKIDDAPGLGDGARRSALGVARDLPRGAALLHGDFHPGNVLVAGDEMFVIDWFDASVGHPVADIVRSSLLLTSAGATDLEHLPGAHPDVVDLVHDDYAAAMRPALRAEIDRLHEWEAVTAASRLAERTDADVSGLLAMCAPSGVSSSRLVACVSGST